MPLPVKGPPVFGDAATPRFLVTVDTEEAFDWDGPFTRDAGSVAHVPALERFQQIAERHGVRPVYLIDYPVAVDEGARAFFADLAARGKAHVGAHLHPWNTPPYEEKLNARNSYGCNLPADLERRKLERLIEAIAPIASGAPLIFRAGRYGAGKATLASLVEFGVRFDTSARPLFDLRRDGGPDFSGASNKPYWLKPGTLAELPVSSVFTGGLRAIGRKLFGSDSAPSLLRGPLSRLHLLSRTAFTPEGISLDEARRGVDRALADGLPLLVFSFHSPSVVPGNTSYVGDARQADRFHNWWEAMFEHCAGRGIAPADLSDLANELFGSNAAGGGRKPAESVLPATAALG